MFFSHSLHPQLRIINDICKIHTFVHNVRYIEKWLIQMAWPERRDATCNACFGNVNEAIYRCQWRFLSMEWGRLGASHFFQLPCHLLHPCSLVETPGTNVELARFPSFFTEENCVKYTLFVVVLGLLIFQFFRTFHFIILDQKNFSGAVCALDVSFGAGMRVLTPSHDNRIPLK